MSSTSAPLYKVGFQAGQQHSRTKAILDPANAQIPSWLRGSLYRTGPGKFEMPLASGEGDYLCEHWFDGFTLLHHYSIESDGIYYRNQYMAEGRARQLAGYPPTAPVVEDCCSALFKKCLSAFVCCEKEEELLAELVEKLEEKLPASRAGRHSCRLRFTEYQCHCVTDAERYYVPENRRCCFATV